MQCLILAGGLGTRMQKVAGNTPKALLPAGPRTFIDWQLRWLAKLGVTHAVLALGNAGDEIRAHVEQLAQADSKAYPATRFEFDGPKLLGTGGAVRKALPLLEDDFLVTYGDSFLPIAAKKLFASHKSSGKGLTLSILENHDKGDKSNVVYEQGELKLYDKKRATPEMRYIDYGMLAFQKRYFTARTAAHAADHRFDLAELITEAVAAKQAHPFVVTRPFYEIGSPEGYKGFQKLLAGVGHDLDRLYAQEMPK